MDPLEPDRKLLVLSRIARPEWVVTDDEHIYQEKVVINLRRAVLGVE